MLNQSNIQILSYHATLLISGPCLCINYARNPQLYTQLGSQMLPTTASDHHLKTSLPSFVANQSHHGVVKNLRM